MDGVHLVFMSMGMGQMKYLVLARNDLTSQMEGRALRDKITMDLVPPIVQ